MKKNLLQRFALWLLSITKYEGLIGSKYSVELSGVPNNENATRYDVIIRLKDSKDIWISDCHLLDIPVLHYYGLDDFESLHHKPNTVKAKDLYAKSKAITVQKNLESFLHNIVKQ